MPNLYLPVSASVISAILLIVYCTKKHLSIRENKIYTVMLISILCDSMLVSAIFINAYSTFNEPLLILLNRIDYTFLFIWASSLFLYTYIVIHKNDENYEKKYKRTVITVVSVFAVLEIVMCSLDIELILIDVLRCTAQGEAVYFSIAACVVYFVLSLLVILFNPKKATKQVIPVFVSIIITVTIAFLFTINPYLICISMGLTIVNLTMYFTIENPDLQMLDIVKKAEAQAQKANQAKTDFLSSMSHEIRTPLNAIVGMTELIQNDDTIDKVKEDARDLLNATNTLLELVNGILDISKIEEGRMELIDKDYDLVENAVNLAKLVQTRIGDKPVTMTTCFSPDIPGVLYGDETKIRQIMTNILTNAVKYTEKGTVDFRIDCTNAGTVSNIVITITDTGHGIKQNQIDSLFDKFVRLEEDKNSSIEGTGLGLALTKKMVEILNGEIEVQSTYGKGTTFIVRLPQVIRSMERKMAPKTAKITTAYPEAKLLIVDDNDLNLKVASRMVEMYGISASCASSGEECLKMCESTKYDLIFMDDMMPRMDGRETMNRLRETPGFSTPIVILTANALEGMKYDYLRAGFDDYLAKPMDNSELSRILDRFLG